MNTAQSGLEINLLSRIGAGVLLRARGAETTTVGPNQKALKSEKWVKSRAMLN
jgi:hypothetical protein